MHELPDPIRLPQRLVFLGQAEQLPGILMQDGVHHCFIVDSVPAITLRAAPGCAGSHDLARVRHERAPQHTPAGDLDGQLSRFPSTTCFIVLGEHEALSSWNSGLMPDNKDDKEMGRVPARIPFGTRADFDMARKLRAFRAALR